MKILHIIEQAYQNRASDVHCTAGEKVHFRIDGQLISTKEQVLKEDIATFLHVASPEASMEGTREQDFAFTHPLGVRTRIHLYLQKGLLSLAIRLFPMDIPSPHELEIPGVVLELISRKSGLLLVTGPTGSGKSTTIASLIHSLNQKHPLHIITLEDPVEYLHQSNKSKISQREVGMDTLSFSQGVRSALRQDPDVIMIGELRDEETIHAAVRAAEAGRLVLGTLHTSRAMLAVQRVIDLFEEGKQSLVRSQLASSLLGVISQRLVSSKTAKERRAQFEVLVNTPGVANLIRSNQMHQIESLMQTGAMHGMQTFEEELRTYG